MARTSRSAGLLAPDALRRYADAIVLQCVGFTAGETVLIDCEIAHRELAVALTESAYRHGAALVDVSYGDRRLQRVRIESAPDEALGVVAKWQQQRLRAAMSESVSLIRIVGDEFPGLLSGLDTTRASRDFQARAKAVRWFMKAVIASRVRWTIVAWPTEAWATSVYPKLAPATAMRRLAEDLLWFCRLTADDGPDGWVRHGERLQRRAKMLTRRRFTALEFRGPGTSLDIGLAPDGAWLGGGEMAGSGRMTYPNFPTEEVFTSPVPGATSGTFRCTTPLSFNGRVIENISGEFHRGRLVAIKARRASDRDLLAKTFATDAGAARLGEVALVDRASRIGQAGRIYGETLLDENAAAHIALGDGFGATRTSGSAINRSAVHLDVMIGSDEVEVTGIGARGRRVPLIVDGEWQLPD